MSIATHPRSDDQEEDSVAVVDPRAPRVGNTITASALVVGIAFDKPILIYLVTVVLLVAVISRWRYDFYAHLWQLFISPATESKDPEPAAPHRFAKLVGATGTTLASALILGGVPLVGYVVAAGIALAAGLAATTDICLGCRMYRSVSFFQRLNVV